MSSVAVRVRGPRGQATITGLTSESTVAEFQDKVALSCGVAPGAQAFKAGFPPSQLALPADASTTISVWGVRHGDSLVLSAAAATGADAAALSKSAAAPAEGLFLEGLTEDAQLAMAIAASFGDAAPSVQPSAQPVRHAPAQTASSRSRALTNSASPSVVYHGLADGRAVVRRVIDSDNSCLFNAVGYTLERSRKVASKLRGIVAQTVAQDPVTFNEGFLGKSNIAYQTWIKDSTKWGGAIELFILSKYYRCKIAAFDIQTKRCDVYGLDEDYPQQCFLIYDGLHYDALALAESPNAQERLDTTCFSVNSPLLQLVTTGADVLVQELHASRKFTDTANFTLRCGVCNKGLKGEQAAVEHAKETGHQNFQEY